MTAVIVQICFMNHFLLNRFYWPAVRLFGEVEKSLALNSDRTYGMHQTGMPRSQLKKHRQQVESRGKDEVIEANYFHMGLFYSVYLSRKHPRTNTHLAKPREPWDL